MVDVYNMKCRTESCGKQQSFGVARTKPVDYCAQHAPDEMVDACSRKGRIESCGKRKSFGVAGTKAVEFCAQHAADGMVDGRQDQKVQNRKGRFTRPPNEVKLRQM